MTPEQAFEKWWDSYLEEHTWNQAPEHIGRMSDAFFAGQQHQETNQLMVLADIKKAVGDGEGRLSQEELVKRIEGLAAIAKEQEFNRLHSL